MMSLFHSHCRPPISMSTIFPPSAGTQTIRLVPPRISTNPNSPAVGKWRASVRPVRNGSFTRWPLLGCCRTEGVERDAARREDTGDGLADAIVWRARPGGHSDTYRSALRKPVGNRVLMMVLAGATVVDLAGHRVDAGRILDVIRGNALGAQHRERDRVAGVEATDDYHRIERLVEQLEHRVLPVLRRRTDRVECPEVGGCIFLAERLGHGLSHFGGNRQRLTR